MGWAETELISAPGMALPWAGWVCQAAHLWCCAGSCCEAGREPHLSWQPLALSCTVRSSTEQAPPGGQCVVADGQPPFGQCCSFPMALGPRLCGGGPGLRRLTTATPATEGTRRAAQWLSNYSSSWPGTCVRLAPAEASPTPLL